MAKSGGRKIGKIVLGLVVLAVLALAGVYIVRNVLVERAVESGSEYALGVKTDLGSARLDVGGSSLALNHYKVENPEGFSDENFMSIDRMAMAVDAGSLLDDEVVVDSLVIAGVRLNLEQINSKGNYRPILDRIQEVAGTSEDQSSKRLKIRRLALHDIQVSGSLTLPGQSPKTKSYKVDDFSLSDVGGDDGATVGEVAARVVKTVIQKSLANGGLLAGFKSKASETADAAKEQVEEKVADQLNSAKKSLLGGN